VKEPTRPPTPDPTYATYIREEHGVRSPSDWKKINIRLVGSHPLWGHFLWVLEYFCMKILTSFARWNASLALASYLDSNVELYKDRDVLELGAGGALPSIVTALNGARKVRRFIEWGSRTKLENCFTDSNYGLSGQGTPGEYRIQRCPQRDKRRSRLCRSPGSYRSTISILVHTRRHL
jgi:hypothetical protein